MRDRTIDAGLSTLVAAALAHPSTWVDARPELEDAVVRAVADAEPRARAPRRRVLVSAAAAAALALVVAATLSLAPVSGSADYRARLHASGVASGASAEAAVTRTDTGFRITLDTVDLPPLRPGEYFQAWLRDPAGTLVPIGTFSARDGRVILWSGVSPAAYPTISVTIEAPDNDQTSSGRRVLIGKVRATRPG